MKEGWRKTTLGDAFTVVTGSTPQKSNPIYFGDYIPLIKPPELLDSVVDIAEDGLSREGALISRIAPAQSILVSCIGNLGKVGINSLPVSFNQQINSILPNTRHALPEFMFYQVLSYDFQCQLEALASGTTISIVNKSKFNSIEIVLPPLDEQQRIVALLDEAFKALATAKANAEQNLQNARVLFESHLESVLSQPREGCKTTTLGAEIDLLAGFAFKSAQYTNDDDGIRLLRGDNIIQGRLRWDDVKKWPANDTQDYARYQLAEGDVVLAMDRPWVKAGLKHATIAADDLPCLLVQRTARLRGGANLDNRFLKLLIGSGAFTSHILGVQTGIGVPHISGQQIKDFEFAFPSLVEQQRIASGLESLRVETQNLTSIYERKLAALEALKTSLLHQAFNGEL